ncbi:PAS domain-containing protein [Mesorhizobium xinjiangense]|uniref:PAS domain-containing protein n=1 Tax=Mesorhizobium xinjiangense TaxID=2678685 RepID=UPI0012ED9E29|nr:PAS domain-containing protein [Mesorhizobium xinjiangense]
MDGTIINWGTLAGQAWPGLAALVTLTALGTVCHANRRARKLAEDHRNATLLMDNLSEGIYRSSLDGKLLTVNDALVRMNGYESKQQMLDAPTDIASECYVRPERCGQFRDMLLRDGVVKDFVSEIYRHKTRERIWIIESARIVRDFRTGRALYYEGSVREYSDTMKRLQLEEQFQKLTRNLPGGLFQVTVQASGRTKVVYLSEGFFETLGMPTREIIESAERFRRRVHPDDRRRFLAVVRDAQDRLRPLDHEFRIMDMQERERWLRMIARPERSGDAIT